MPRPGPDVDLRVRPTPPPAPWIRPSPPSPQSSPVDLRLKPRAGGGYVVQDGPVWAEIHRDGQITFHDRPPFRPGSSAAPDRTGQALQSAGNGPNKLPEIGDLQNPVPSAQFTLDLNDALLRSLGDDPYAALKRNILERTRALRHRLSDEACKEDLRESILSLNAKLEDLWSRTHLSGRARRERLFALWDECLEEGQGMRAQHGEIARRTITAFIRRTLPRGSSGAFLPEELRALNRRRRSQERFEPYKAL